jgi:AraC family transcriptional regulator
MCVDGRSALVLRVGSVTLAHRVLDPTEGTYFGSRQLVATISRGAPCQIDWRSGDSDQLRTNIVSDGQTHVGHGHPPLWIRSKAEVSFFAFGMDDAFVTQVWRHAFDGNRQWAIHVAKGLNDPAIERLCVLGQQELERGGASGRLYVESLATACAIHLLRDYGSPQRRTSPHKGGLVPGQLRRVVAYMDANLREDLSLSELAEVTGLSPHHFGQAFKMVTGMSPHRYLICRRVERARALLRDPALSIAEIAAVVGFANQSHLTVNFRRLTGLTPARFRQSGG